jgi:hypothetical protein
LLALLDTQTTAITEQFHFPRHPITPRRKNSTQTAMQDKAPSQFRFLDLPPELRNLIYSYTYAETGSSITTPLGTPPEAMDHGERKPTPALALTCKQVYQEAYQYAYRSASIYWPTSPEGGERYCVSCGRHHRRRAVEQMCEALSRYGSKLSEVTHLNIWGGEAEFFVWETECAGDETFEIPDNCGICEWWEAETTQVARRLRARLENVETITVFVGKEDTTGFRERAAKWALFGELLQAFPKLRVVRMGSAQGVEVVAEKERVLANLHQSEENDGAIE